MRELAYERRFREWAAERGMSAELLRYPREEAGGETLAYRFSPAGPPSARVLVAHGGGNDALYSFPGLFKELLHRGLEVFTFDLDGHGRASTTRFDPAAITGAVEAALVQACAVRPELPVHAMGVSLGGSILLQALPRVGDLVSSVILVSAPLHVEFGLRAILTELGLPLLRAATRQREHVGPWGLIPSFGPVKRGAYPLRLAQTPEGAFGYVSVFNEALRGMELEAAAEAVRIPVLLVYGTRDRLVPPEQGRLLAERIADAELLLVEEGTHLTTLFSDAATEHVLAWLGGAGKGSRRESQARKVPG